MLLKEELTHETTKNGAIQKQKDDDLMYLKRLREDFDMFV
jgi:hypothetical protein